MRGAWGWLRLLSSVLAAGLLAGLLAGSAQGADLYQVSTIEALTAGLYAPEATFAELARHGDFGLGTLVNLDGEMVALDGVFYQVTSDGAVHVVPPEARTPFAQVVFFKGAVDLGRADGVDLDGLKAALAARLPDPTRMYAVRVDGTFPSLTLRSPPAQAEPWPPLAEALKGQSLFGLQAVTGTIVGFYSPTTMPGLTPPGWHFHFLTADRTRGGHVLAARLGDVTVRADRVDTLFVDFPDNPLPRPSGPAVAPGTE